MIRNNFLTRFIVVTLTTALLLMMGSRAIPVSALADPVPITAVYDTQIIQLADYVDSLPQPSVDIFYILCGVLAAAQLGGQEYKLEDPYATSSDVLDWFKSMGIRIYNTVIGLAPNRDTILGFDVRPYIKPLVAAMMGNAVLSRNYGSVQEFLDSEDDVLIPFHQDIQKSINVLWQIQGGPYHWQFDTEPFKANVTYKEYTMSGAELTQYNNYLADVPTPHVRVNGNYVYNYIYGSDFFATYTNLFINSSTNTYYLADSHGNFAPVYPYTAFSANYVRYYLNGAYHYNERGSVNRSMRGTYDPSQFNTMVELVQYLYDHGIFNSDFVFLEDFVQHVYVGTNWINKQELFNIHGLNIDADGNDYYFQSPTTNDYLIDIKNMIDDLVNKTNIWDVVIDNIYDNDGIKIDLPVFGRISVSLDEIIDRLAPPVPVDLNDIAELTDNTYLERVKEHARNAGDIFANYVAFWHNCDSDLVYTLFGAGILVLVGAFVGKWGHS